MRPGFLAHGSGFSSLPKFKARRGVGRIPTHPLTGSPQPPHTTPVLERAYADPHTLACTGLGRRAQATSLRSVEWHAEAVKLWEASTHKTDGGDERGQVMVFTQACLKPIQGLVPVYELIYFRAV